MRVASEAFHVVVHVAFSQRLRRRFVQHVLLLHGLDEAQLPRTLALVESRVDAHALTWRCNARLEDRGLIWETPGIVTPPAVAERLADIPEATWSAYCFDPLARPAGTPVPEQGDASAEALAKAHAALREGAWQEAVIHLDAAAQQRHDHQVVSLIDAALADLPELAQVIDQTIAATIQDVRAAIQAGDLEGARVLISAPPANAVVQRRQLSHSSWQALCAEVTRRAEQVIACQSALTRANVQQHEGDLHGALQTLRPFDARLVGPELAPVLLTARQRVLMRLLSQVRGDAAARQQYTAELEQANRDLAELHGLDDVGTEPAVLAGLPAAPAQVVIESVRPAAPVPQLPAPTSTSPRPSEPMPSAPGQGWLDEALARSRERIRLRQSAQADGEGTP
jgi:hypothetical protein